MLLQLWLVAKQRAGSGPVVLPRSTLPGGNLHDQPVQSLGHHDLA